MPRVDNTEPMDLKVKKLGDLISPISAMARDVMDAEVTMETRGAAHERRNYVRALFAYIEGSVFLIKQTAFSRAILSRFPLTLGEYAIMKEETYSLDRAGRVQVQDKFVNLAANLRFTVGCVNRIFDSNLSVNETSHHWSDFLRAIEIRDRITHPKGLAEFEVSEAEIQLCQRVCDDWFSELVAALITSVHQRISVQRNDAVADAPTVVDDSESGSPLE